MREWANRVFTAVSDGSLTKPVCRNAPLTIWSPSRSQHVFVRPLRISRRLLKAFLTVASVGTVIVWSLVGVAALLMARVSIRRHGQSENHGWGEAPKPRWYRRWWVVGLVLLAVGFIATNALSGGGNSHGGVATGVVAAAAIHALPALAPGALNPLVDQSNIHETVCKSGWTAKVRPPVANTDALKRSQLREWGYTDTNPAHYAEDHRVPLSSGGAPMDPANLWPQSRSGQYSAAAKDLIEIRVNRDICSGKLTLAQAQAIWLGNWWTATVP